MPENPIYGFSGNHPVLSYGGVNPVLMQPASVNYAANNFNLQEVNNAYPVYEATSYLEIAPQSITPNTNFSLWGTKKFLAGAQSYMRFWLTASQGLQAYEAFVELTVEGQLAGELDLQWPTGNQYGSIVVPYYRFTGRIVMAANDSSLASTDFVRLTWGWQ